MYQIVQENDHFLFISNDKIELTVSLFQSYALPAIEGDSVQLSFTHRVDVLPEDPEPGGETTISKAFDLINLAARFRLLFYIIVKLINTIVILVIVFHLIHNILHSLAFVQHFLNVDLAA